jgi:hypothetical protein
MVSFKLVPMVAVMLVTLSLSGCGTSSSIRSDSSPPFANVKEALAQTGVSFCNLSLSSGGTFCDRRSGGPVEATVYTGVPASMFSGIVSLAKAPSNTVWTNGRTIVALPNPSRSMVAALARNGFKRSTSA